MDGFAIGVVPHMALANSCGRDEDVATGRHVANIIVIGIIQAPDDGKFEPVRVMYSNNFALASSNYDFIVVNANHASTTIVRNIAQVEYLAGIGAPSEEVTRGINRCENVAEQMDDAVDAVSMLFKLDNGLSCGVGRENSNDGVLSAADSYEILHGNTGNSYHRTFPAFQRNIRRQCSKTHV